MNALQWTALSVGIPLLVLLVVQSVRIERRDIEIRRLRKQLYREYLAGRRDGKLSEIEGQGRSGKKGPPPAKAPAPTMRWYK